MNSTPKNVKRGKAMWITKTAAMTALLIVMQAITSALGNTLVTGSIVNLILVITVMTCGLVSGLTVAAMSPVFAKLFGIGPLWSLIPFIMLGNIVLVLLWHLIGSRIFAKAPVVPYIIAVIVAAGTKFAVLYLGVVRIAVPILLKLPAPQAGVISNMFAVPQLFTALIGGAVAAVILPTLRKAIGAFGKSS